MTKKLKKSELDTSLSGPAHCQFCGERFMGEDRAEVVFKFDVKEEAEADPSEVRDPIPHMIIHATCFDPERMEIA
jgi:hypothetical protein